MNMCKANGAAMKLAILVLAILLAESARPAEKKPISVGVKYKNMSVSFVQQPTVADPKLLPLIDGVSGSAKDRVGIHFGSTFPTTPVLEVLDAHANVLQTLSMNDVIGKGVSKEDKLLPSGNHAKPRRCESVYTVRVGQHEADVVIKAIATGDEGAVDQRLVVTFALKTKLSIAAALRLKLPITGTAEEAGGHVIITSQLGTVALAAAVFPSDKTLRVEKSRVVISSAPRTTEPGEETPLLWLVIRGVSSSSPTDAKSQAQLAVQENVSTGDEPRLVVVNAADKERLAQADTASYSVVCTNIGTGEASNVVLGNPIPKGTKYIEGSATTAGMQFSVEQKSDVQSGATQNLKWTLLQPLKPGEERIVSFKVVVQ